MEKAKLLALLAKDEIDQLLAALEQVTAARTDLHQDWVALSGRHHRLRSQELKGVLPQVDIEVERNQIHDALYTLIERRYAPGARMQDRLGQVWRQWRWPLLVLGVALIVLLIGLLPVKQASFKVVLKTTDLAFRLAAPWPETFNFAASRLDLGPLRSLSSLEWGFIQDEVGQPLNLSVDTGHLEVGPLYIPAKERISMRCRAQEITLGFGETVSGEINLIKGSLLGLPDGVIRTFGGGKAGSELLQWNAEPSTELTFLARQNPAFQLPVLEVSAIEFIKKEDSLPKSAILGGRLEVLGHDPLPLEASDRLEFGQLYEANCRVVQHQDTLEITLRGKTDQIETGSQTLYSRKPSLLEYFYQDQKVYFFCSVLISLIGLLWSVKGALGLGKAE